MTPLLPSPTPPPSGVVLVCALEIPRALSAPLASRLRALLPDDERARHDRFSHEGAGAEYLCGRALLRASLSSWVDVPTHAWRLALNAHGRPSVAAPHHTPTVHFNLSHTRGMVVLALGLDPEVGVDVEQLARTVNPLEIADRFFSPAETAALRALPAQRHLDRFLALWTLKEAYIKARGMGLALPLQDFTFTPDAAPPRVRFEPSLGDDHDAWRFWRDDLPSGHRVAVAAKVARLDVRIARVDLETLARAVGLPHNPGAV